MPYKEGQWERSHYKEGPDSSLHGIRHNNNSKLANIDRISLGVVSIVQAEPLYKSHTVMVDMVTGGKLTNVAWPGGQVNANATGLIPGGVALGVHGLWEAPLPGQQVLIGYVDGSNGNPIVINKYQYNAMQRPDLEVMHTLPMTTKAHGPTDVILGHHTGSYIALRGTIPLPAQIDIFSMSSLNITAPVFMNITVLGQVTEAYGTFSNNTTTNYSVAAGAVLDLASLGTAKIKGTAAMTVESAAAVFINATPSVIINSGTRPVAAMGDLTTTLLGPMPIIATGTACLVP